MNILVLGKDKRYIQIIERFKEKNKIDIIGWNDNIDGVNNININNCNTNKYDIIIFPMYGILEGNIIKGDYDVSIDKDFFKNIKEKCIIFTGIMTNNLKELTRNNKVITFMDDSDIVSKNAIPTVEGIIEDLIINTDITLYDSNIMVIGYGNIGKRLCDILKYMGANITVGIIDENDIDILQNKKLDYIFTDDKSNYYDALEKSEIIVNTAPSRVIDEGCISHLNRDSYILDISSSPYGIDEEVLNLNNIKNKIYSSIPGKIAPKTSGLILSKRIESILGG